jgi:TRAP transporter TAXI family solute receptor
MSPSEARAEPAAPLLTRRGLIGLAALGLLTSGARAQGPLLLTLTGASPGGLWSLLGAGIHAAVAAALPGSAVTYQTSGGGFANVMLVSQGRAELGIVHNAELRAALDGRAPFRAPVTNLRALATLYDWAPIQWVLVRSFADRFGITSVDELVAARPPVRFGVNTRGNMVQEVNRAILQAYGVDYADIEEWGGQIVYAASSEMAELMANRRIDLSGNGLFAPDSSIVQTGNALPVTMLSLSRGAVERVAAATGTVPYTIPAGSYDWLERAIPTVALGALLVTSAALAEDVAYSLTRALIEHIDRLRRVHTAMQALTRELMAAPSPIPHHPGAVRYFREAGLAA